MSQLTAVDLEEIVPRRDYRLKYVFGCIPCIGTRFEKAQTHIFLHRTEEDLETQRNNVYQICMSKHITRPFKRCTKCGRVYQPEDIICDICEITVTNMARYEVLIEQRLKDVARLEKSFRRKKIQEHEFNAKLVQYYDEINLAKKELEKIEEKKKKQL